MHAGWLVDMASLWAFHASTLIHQREPMSTEAVNEYWIRNRVRFDGWNAMLSRLRSQTLSLSVAKRVRAWDKLCSLIEEVLLSEPLARVSAAFAAELEERQIDNDSHSILHNVFAAHSEVRHRCLKIILEGIERIESAATLFRTLERHAAWILPGVSAARFIIAFRPTVSWNSVCVFHFSGRGLCRGLRPIDAGFPCNHGLDAAIGWLQEMA